MEGKIATKATEKIDSEYFVSTGFVIPTAETRSFI